MIQRLRKAAGSLRDFFNGAGLPVCLLTVAVIYEAFLLAVMFAPAGSGPWSRFAEEFKVWCFSYNPATGGMEWGAAWIMLLEPPILALTTAVFYRRHLARLGLLGAFRIHWRAALTGGTLTASILLGLTSFARSDPAATAVLPFPGKRIRTQIQPPAIQLTDQNGVAISLESLRGKVVLITGVYATCSTACPQILLAVKRVLGSLPEADRGNFVVLALSLDPRNDASWQMSAIAETYFPGGQFHYLNGAEQVVRSILEPMGFAAIRNEETGMIDHANLFIFVDAAGRIAYRFGLDPGQESWMYEAAAELLAEARKPTTLARARRP